MAQPPPNSRDSDENYLRPRRGHVPQISISDESYHITESIGNLYDDDYNRRDPRPLSFQPSPPLEPRSDKRNNYFEPSTSSPHSRDGSLARSLSAEREVAAANGSPSDSPRRNASMGSNHGSPSSPPALTRTPSSDTAQQPFPLNDIDYESSPAAVAQELSNLQAIRRMSMNIDAADPDLPTFGSGFGMPSVAPSHTSDEDDASRLFWVPARLHPELAPKEFKTFVEDRVDRIRRRSGEESSSSLSPSDRQGSPEGVRRRKSTLSKTIVNGVDYQDGAEVLDRKKSESGHSNRDSSETTLQELESLVSDPSELVRKLSIDRVRKSFESGGEGTADDDMPILPSTPGGQSLKRSTRTNYRRGSLRKGERVPTSSRIAKRLMGAGEAEDVQSSSSTPAAPDDGQQPPLTRTQTEPAPMSPEAPENFSRPSRGARPRAILHPTVSLDDLNRGPSEFGQEAERSTGSPRSFHSRISSNGRTTAALPGFDQAPSVPQIIETPPPSEYRHSAPQFLHGIPLPERTSSHEFSRANSHSTSLDRPPLRPHYNRPQQQNQSLDDMANNPSLMPGTNTRTDALSFIPTYDEKRPEPDRKSKDKKDSSDSSLRRPSWGWLLGNEEKDKDKGKKEDKESSKKSKSKGSKTVDKSHDSARLDVLQTATDGPRGRESLVLDRESVRLDEERRKESSRKSTGSDKKEKDSGSGLFSSLFGGGKKKGDRESTGPKKVFTGRGLSLSPEPPPRILRADIDYNWTRFSILEERAIYRMAHIKLANPRRALYSQVLLSNFMYSYLAKVQQMHPQIQIPQFVNQKQGPAPSQQESDEFSQWQRYQEQQERLAQGKGTDGEVSPTSPPLGGGSTFVDDYDPNHQQQEDNLASSSWNSEFGNGNANGLLHQLQYHQQHGGPVTWGNHQEQGDDPYSQSGLFNDTRPPEDEDMW